MQKKNPITETIDRGHLITVTGEDGNPTQIYDRDPSINGVSVENPEKMVLSSYYGEAINKAGNRAERRRNQREWAKKAESMMKGIDRLPDFTVQEMRKSTNRKPI